MSSLDSSTLPCTPDQTRHCQGRRRRGHLTRQKPSRQPSSQSSSSGSRPEKGSATSASGFFDIYISRWLFPFMRFPRAGAQPATTSSSERNVFTVTATSPLVNSLHASSCPSASTSLSCCSCASSPPSFITSPPSTSSSRAFPPSTAEVPYTPISSSLIMPLRLKTFFRRLSETITLPPKRRLRPIITFLSGGRTAASSTDPTLIHLGPWDQTAMRAYMRVALCFPIDTSCMDAAVKHLEAALVRLASQRPDLAGMLETHSGGQVYLRLPNDTANVTIPFSVVDLGATFPYSSYADLQAANFPPSAFVDPAFAQACQMGEDMPGVPVATIKAFTISGGLLLGIFFCHAFADGECLRIFLEAFAAQTCETLYNGPSTKQLHVPPLTATGPQNTIDKTLDKPCVGSLLERIPEYVLMDEPVGPTTPRLRRGGIPIDDIEKTGIVFVFRNERLGELRASIEAVLRGVHVSDMHSKEKTIATQGPPSNYTCLAALAWAHLVRARRADAVQYMPHDVTVDDKALLQTMVNWKGRAFQAANPDYFGNATAVAVTRLPTDGALAAACTDRTQLAELVWAIEKTIAGVDETYVRDRTALFSGVADPRRIGLRFDPRTPQDLGFNTWRYFGADTQWVIPGVCAAPRAPDKIRRLQDMWNMSGALILPARATSDVHELLVTLPKTSMEVLCQDTEWMKWVDDVIV